MDNSAILAAAAAADAQAIDTSVDPERVLLVDGDALAYSCAGNDDTDPAQARRNLIDKVQYAAARTGSGRVLILLTMPGSHKGHRYAVARYQPYQGNRSNSRRPKNWAYLRGLLENQDLPFEFHATNTAEADDLFGYHANRLPHGKAVIFTEDKDMRMVPGLHLTWRDYLMVDVPPGTWEIVSGGKVYGEKWFWLQMLHGDTADHIKGLPNFRNAANVVKPMGEVTAAKTLDQCSPDQARRKVMDLYVQNHTLDLLFENAVLLWMRMDKDAPWYDVFMEGRPLQEFVPPVLLANRVAEAEALNAASQTI